MNSTLIDIICLLFFIVMAIIGYKKGFIVRLYDLLMLIIVFILTYIFSEPLSHVFHIYQYDPNDIIMKTIGFAINRFCVMVILFLGLWLGSKIIGIFIKPLLQRVVEIFRVTECLDHMLGFLFSIAEAFVIVYIVILFIISPLYPQGREMVNGTIITKQLVKLVPSIGEDILNLPKVNLTNIDKHSTESIKGVMDVVLMIEDYGLVNEEQFMDVYEQYVAKHLNGKKLTITASQKDQLNAILDKSQLSNKDKQKILNQMIVSE